MAVCNERFDRRDERVLNAFFGQGSDKVACMKAISRCDIDDFRPLVNFLKESTNSTNDNNIELLAWLIDFAARPYDDRRDYASTGSKDAGEPKAGSGADADSIAIKTGIEKPGQSEENGSSPSFSVNEQLAFFKKRRAVILLVLLVLAGFGIFWLVNKASGSTPAGACMLWAGNHYQPVPCSQKSGNALVIPLDSEKIAHFKKITRPDTITENALGSVWYVNFHGVYECYTSPGFHPVDTNLKLRLLTDYVLLRHIRSNQAAEKTSE